VHLFLSLSLPLHTIIPRCRMEPTKVRRPDTSGNASQFFPHLGVWVLWPARCCLQPPVAHFFKRVGRGACPQAIDLDAVFNSPHFSTRSLDSFFLPTSVSLGSVALSFDGVTSSNGLDEYTRYASVFFRETLVSETRWPRGPTFFFLAPHFFPVSFDRRCVVPF